MPHPLRAAHDRARFDLHVDRVRSALLAALGRRDGDPARAAAARAEQRALDATLAGLGDPLGRDAWLAARCGLSPDEQDFLWTAIAVASDPRVLPVARVLGGAEARRGVTPAFFCAAFGLDGSRARALAAALAPARPALRWRLLVPREEGWVRTATPFTVAPRVIAFLRGEDEPDPLAARAGGVVHPVAAPIFDEGQERALARLEEILEIDQPLLALVEGRRGAGRKTAVAAAAGRPVFALDLSRLGPGELEPAVVAWGRECLLRGALPLVCDLDALAAADRQRLAVLLDELPGLVAATASAEVGLPVHRPLVRVRYPMPGPAARRRLWAGHVDAGVDLDLVARRYPLGAGGVARAIQAARLADPEGALDTAAVIAGVRASLAEGLSGLVTRVEVSQSWDDLVLPDEVATQVRALVARVRHGYQVLERWGVIRLLPRGQGVAALLSGPPGTGKTMVAGLVARELGLDLLQVDLSQVVSKWIGETEKQLAAVFDAAEAGSSLLLFDEADALFARRTTEVKGAVDRYANLEVNYLLSRIESFGGIVLLTTNLETGIDPAIKRRLAAHITFYPPDEDERARLWQRLLPPAVPLEGQLDTRALARGFPDMCGAHIRNTVVAAAFLAAGEDRPLSPAVLEHAARSEYHSMGRVLAARRRS